MAGTEVPTEVIDLSGLGEPVAFTCSKCAPAAVGSSDEEIEPVEAAAGCLDTVVIGVLTLFRPTPPAKADRVILSELGAGVAFTCRRCTWATCSCGDLARFKMREGLPPQPDEVATAIIGFVRAWLRLAS